MKKMKGFTLIELLIVVAIIAILAAIAVPNFLEAQVRSKVSRVKADQRSLATAMESYYVDKNQYPAYNCGSSWPTSDGATGANAFATSDKGCYGLKTFRINSGAADDYMHQVTTPVGYITNYFSDPFANTRGSVFGYYSDPTEQGWILWSYGPDTDEQDDYTSDENSDLNSTVQTVYNVFERQPSDTLVTGSNPDFTTANDGNFTYDPTNGTTSPGDVWRVKQ